MRRSRPVTSSERARLGLPDAPVLRLVQRPSPDDLRRTAVRDYARAILELQSAARLCEVAYWSRDATAIRRTLRGVLAANLRADRAYDRMIDG